MTPPDGHDLLRQAFEEAKDAPPPTPPPANDQGGGDGISFVIPRHILNQMRLPEDCPVIPLGKNGGIFYYLDTLKQVRELTGKDHGNLQLRDLFDRDPWFLVRTWPRLRLNKETGEWEAENFKGELAASALMGACSRKGVFKPDQRVRGIGAWRGEDGTLLLHCGDVVLLYPVDGGVPHTVEPGLVGDFVYPGGDVILQPAVERPKGGKDGPGAKIRDLFATWSMRRPDLDPDLLLGMVGCMMVGGALTWRPLMWLTGSRYTGKSSLQTIIKWLLGTHGILSVTDPTAAAISQTLRHDTRPCAIDELEPSEDGRKAASLLTLAREAASGSMRIRGSNDHKPVTFVVRSCFFFSSILIPPLEPADRSRMVIIELGELKTKKKPGLTEAEANDLGRALWRRIVDQWPRFAATLELYHTALMDRGHSSRTADVFGTVLAVRDLIMHDDMPHSDYVDEWAEKLKAGSLAELEGDVSDEESCLMYLATKSLVDAKDRKELTVGAWVYDYVQADGDRQIAINRLLAGAGLKMVEVNCVRYLAVANMHAGLQRLFDGTKWAGRAGTIGVWKQALDRLPGVLINHAVWMGKTLKSTLIPASMLLPGNGGAPGGATPQDSSAAGNSPGTAPASGTPAAEASSRSAADTAFDLAAPAPTQGGLGLTDTQDVY